MLMLEKDVRKTRAIYKLEKSPKNVIKWWNLSFQIKYSIWTIALYPRYSKKRCTISRSKLYKMIVVKIKEKEIKCCNWSS